MLASPAAHAQSPARPEGEDRASDLADWDIEDLLEVRIPSMTSVLGGHVHNKGEWMPMLRTMSMRMDGLRDGTDELSTAEVLASFPVSPTTMTTQMVAAGVMYGWSDDLTLMGMVPYVRKSMDHRTGAGGRFTTRSEGVGDAQLSALYTVWEDYESHFHLNLGLSVPTGSVEERDATPMGPAVKLPYPMQLGSGTWDLNPGLTFLRDGSEWGWGAQAKATLRLGENDEGYSFGDRAELTAWWQRRATDSLSVSARATGRAWSDVDGADPELNPMVVPTADPDRQAGERVDLSLGLEWHGRDGGAAGHRLELEVGVPVHESLDGPQMSTDYWIILGWSVTL